MGARKHLSLREKKLVCHQVFCKHLSDYWDMYGPIANVSLTLRSLPLIETHEIESLLRGKLDKVIPYTGLRKLPKVFDTKLGVTYEGLYLLIVWVFLVVEDHKNPPNQTSEGAKRCPK